MSDESTPEFTREYICTEVVSRWQGKQNIFFVP